LKTGCQRKNKNLINNLFSKIAANDQERKFCSGKEELPFQNSALSSDFNDLEITGHRATVTFQTDENAVFRGFRFKIVKNQNWVASNLLYASAFSFYLFHFAGILSLFIVLVSYFQRS
jgi:hypothetical protein